jgi:hypothetical protein
MPINEQIRRLFVKKSCLTQTSSSIRQTDDKHHSCSYCSKLFSSPSHLSRHILIHTGEKPCLCSECGQQFSQISSLERHQRTKHDKETKFNSSNNHFYQCKLCHEYFSLKHNLKMHEKRLHQIQTNFFCHLCSAYFTCNSSLQKHRHFRHRSLIKNQQSNEISTNTMSDNWTLTQNDQVRENIKSNTKNNNALFQLDSTTTLLSASQISTEISSVNSNDSFNNNNIKPIPFQNTNKHSCQQQVHYQILKCNEIN